MATVFGYLAGMTIVTMRPGLTPVQFTVMRQFLQFSTVGLAGLAVDTVVIYSLCDEIGLQAAGLVSYLLAATTTWTGNRAWTFAGQRDGSALRQWLLYLAANGVGFILNRGAYLALVTFVPFVAAHPILAILAGVAAGLASNFHMSRRVFAVKL